MHLAASERGELAGRGANAPANLTFALLDSIHAKADWVRCPPLPLYCRHWRPPLAPPGALPVGVARCHAAHRRFLAPSCLRPSPEPRPASLSSC